MEANRKLAQTITLTGHLYLQKICNFSTSFLLHIQYIVHLFHCLHSHYRAMHSASVVMKSHVVCSSVCLSVCLSVCNVDG